eukprot:CAMPEP_0114108750 /NCGR_PEP_ID=MMETSP0043_2-20121206/395_1 /TAXON_ID=464988 /ORGANISM="Hemiselmis andersenii, Strain CCMP644" /LENGTH=121 /DNA_ID=CAMNT_0001200553 /DNA_START=70 /DNA_END=433 /DNA_ORIENTATION=-
MADPSAVIKNAQTAADARQAMMYALVRPQTDMKEEMRMEATDTVVSAIEKFGNMKPPKYDVAPPPSALVCACRAVLPCCGDACWLAWGDEATMGAHDEAAAVMVQQRACFVFVAAVSRREW